MTRASHKLSVAPTMVLELQEEKVYLLFRKNVLQQFPMESCQPIKRLKDKKKNGSGMLMDMGHPD
jgi:hypothetical protein